MTYATPPSWAAALLRLMLAPRDRETVTGDLLEQYRDSVLPARGEQGADLWYVAEVGRYALRTTFVWAVLMAVSVITRTGYDWLTPTTDFHFRSVVSTYLGIAILFVAGCATAWRTGTIRGGVVASVLTAGLAAIISVLGLVAFLAVRHDAATLAAVEGSGGLEEAFTLPFMIIVPAVILGTIGGLFGSRLKRAD